MQDVQQLESLLKTQNLISNAVLGGVLKFYELLLEENKVQNLTRLTSPEDFIEGHLLDVLELLKSDFLQYPAMDLGSGPGVPGLLASLIEAEAKPWVLCESEKSKALFLARVSSSLSLNHVQVHSGRAEDFLKTNKVGSVVCRAVGNVQKIYSWLRPCSTWNNLILFKGPSWEEEWKDAPRSAKLGDLKVKNTKKYFVGAQKKERVLLEVVRETLGV